MYRCFRRSPRLSAVAGGPQSALYLTEIDLDSESLIVRVQGSEFDSAIANNTSESPLAVNGHVRTAPSLAHGQGDESVGGKYTLGLAFTGRTFVHNTPEGGRLLDATTDGTHIYAIGFNTGAVFRYNLDWSEPEFMFDIGGLQRLCGHYIRPLRSHALGVALPRWDIHREL